MYLSRKCSTLATRTLRHIDSSLFHQTPRSSSKFLHEERISIEILCTRHTIVDYIIEYPRRLTKQLVPKQTPKSPFKTLHQEHQQHQISVTHVWQRVPQATGGAAAITCRRSNPRVYR